jgi:hypothetical protein
MLTKNIRWVPLHDADMFPVFDRETKLEGVSG